MLAGLLAAAAGEIATTVSAMMSARSTSASQQKQH
jgi:hypothetical protein